MIGGSSGSSLKDDRPSETSPPPPLFRPDGKDVFSVFAGGFVAFAVLVAAVVIANTVSDGVFLRRLAEEPSKTWLQITVGALVLLSPVYLVGIKLRRLAWRDLGFVAPTVAWIIGAMMLGLVAHYAIGLVHLSLGEPLKDVMTRTFDPAESRMIDRVIVLAAVTTIVPLVEEVYFRGLLFRWLANRWGLYLGLLISAVAFGALHGDWIWAAATAVLGVLLAYVYWRSGSIWTSIILHASYNGGGMIGIFIGN